jgi:hypothetical protein
VEPDIEVDFEDHAGVDGIGWVYFKFCKLL